MASRSIGRLAKRACQSACSPPAPAADSTMRSAYGRLCGKAAREMRIRKEAPRGASGRLPSSCSTVSASTVSSSASAAPNTSDGGAP
eukprot:5431078-Prymnesium_polylepis.1